MKYQECLCEIANLYLAGDINSVKILDKILRSKWREFKGTQPLSRKGWFLELKTRPVLHCGDQELKFDLAEIIDRVNYAVSLQEPTYADRMLRRRVSQFNRRSGDFLRY